MNVNAITITQVDEATRAYDVNPQADVRGHETPRIVSWKGAWRVEKVARAPGAPAMINKSERE